MNDRASLSAIFNCQPFNRLTNTSSATYTYNNNGNLISKTDGTGTTQYAWDFENRLKQVTLPNGNVVTYKYDALGRRIERSAGLPPPLPPTTTTRFIYDGADVIRDTNAAGVTTANYLNGPGIDNKLRQSVGVAAFYFVQDHLGSTRALTDGNGNVVEQQQYDSFGNSAGSNLTRYGYTGRERDPDTGLLYYRARFYDPQIGRFISEDPIAFRGGDNFYQYVGNSPLRFTDPLGLAAACADANSGATEQTLTPNQANVVWNALERARIALERPLCRKYIGEGAYNALRKLWDDRRIKYFHGTMFDRTDHPNQILMAAAWPNILWRSSRIVLSYNYFHDPTGSELARAHGISPLEERALTLLHEARHLLCHGCGYNEAHWKWDEDIIKYCFK